MSKKGFQSLSREAVFSVPGFTHGSITNWLANFGALGFLMSQINYLIVKINWILYVKALYKMYATFSS